MKNKIITITALLAVMVAMTGIAAADPDQMNIYKKGTNTKVANVALPVGGTVDLDLEISEFANPANTTHNITIRLFAEDEVTEIEGLEIQINETTSPFGPKPDGVWNEPANNPIVIWKQDQGTGKGTSERLKLKITDRASLPQKYVIEFTDTQTNKTTRLSGATLPVSVPEFPTIALPVAAIMGLVFLIYHRKKKEEQ